MTTARQQHDERRRKEMLEQAKRTKESALYAAEQAEIITEAIESGHPLWTKTLEPMLEADVRMFKESIAWNRELSMEQMKVEQGAAARSLAILQSIRSHVGRADEFRKKAEEAGNEIARLSGIELVGERGSGGER